MKCKECLANWNSEDDGGCYINKLEELKNGEFKQGCKLGVRKIIATINEFKKQESDFYEGFIRYVNS
jgi:hypothetical protein